MTSINLLVDRLKHSITDNFAKVMLYSFYDAIWLRLAISLNTPVAYYTADSFVAVINQTIFVRVYIITELRSFEQLLRSTTAHPHCLRHRFVLELKVKLIYFTMFNLPQSFCSLSVRLKINIHQQH